MYKLDILKVDGRIVDNHKIIARLLMVTSLGLVGQRTLKLKMCIER